MIVQTVTTSFKEDILKGVQDLSTDVINMALYTATANLDANTLVYTSVGEVTDPNYTAGGNDLTVNVTPTNTGNVAYVSFANTSWTNATITANGAMIYNSSRANACVAVLAFGGDKTSTNGTFAVNFPTADAASAIIRLTAS